MNSMYRALAREALANNWKAMSIIMFIALVFAMIVPQLIYLLIVPKEVLYATEVDMQNNPAIALQSIPANLLLLVVQLVTTVFTMSFFWVSLNLIRGQKVDTNELISNVTSSGRLLKFTLLYQLYLILWAFLLFIPAVIKFFSYSLAPFILKDNPNMTASEAITTSRALMDGRKVDLFVLNLTFIGWGLLACIFFMLANGVLIAVFGDNLVVANFLGTIVTAIIIAPLQVYYRVTIAVFYEKVLAEANKPNNGNGSEQESQSQSINLNKADNNGQGSITL